MNLLGLYTRTLGRYPVRTEMVTSALLWFVGDITAQKLGAGGGGGNNAANDSRAATMAATMAATPEPSPPSTAAKLAKERRRAAERAKAVVAHHPASTAAKKRGLHAQRSGSAVGVDAATSSSSGRSLFGIDWNRAAVQTAYAAFVWAPVGHHWYKLLHGLALRVAKEGTRLFVATKMAMEIFALHPLALFTFFAVVGVMNGESSKEIWKQMRRDYWPSLALEVVLWTPIDFANFLWVPVRHQLLVANFGCLVESVLLSSIKADGFSLPWSSGGDESDKTVPAGEKTE